MGNNNTIPPYIIDDSLPPNTIKLVSSNGDTITVENLGESKNDKFITPQNCGNCEHWDKETKDCECPVLFPEANIWSSVSEGFKRKMPANDGRLCPTHKRKEENNENST